MEQKPGGASCAPAPRKERVTALANVCAVKMENITKCFGKVTANKDVTLELYKGEILSLLGENGSGKTTLMNMLSGIYFPDEGQIYIDGKPVTIASPKDAFALGIGMIHQHFKLVDVFTATENIILGMPGKLNLAEARKKVQEICDRYGFDIDPDQKIYDMSVSQKQTVEIVKVLYRGANILILDEPTAVLTPQETDKLFAVMRNMKNDGKSLIIITHKLHEVLDVSDRVAVLRKGEYIGCVQTKDANQQSLTDMMVGRSVSDAVVKQDIRIDPDARTIMSIRKLWVDMPGEIVRNVNLDIKEGEILGIGGLAGQGKLGIPNGVMGLYEAGGTVEFDGKPIALNSPRKCLDSQLAFVSEDRRGVGLLLDESLEWNVAFPAMQVQNKFLKRMGFFTWRDEKAIHTVTNRYIDELQIKCTGSGQKARELSGGNQQKVCLAKAFALEPRFLFVSEPTRGIDVGAKALVLEALKKFNRESGVTVVMISSELEELRQICDRIAIVSGGRVAGILPADHSSEEFGMLMVSQVK